MIEQEIIQRCAAAKLRLRFDKVVLRLVGNLKNSLADFVPEGQAVIFTVTAPIKLPAKTIAALDTLLRGDFSGGEVQGNQVLARRLTGVAADRPRVLGFVHNPESDAGHILDLAEARLHER